MEGQDNRQGGKFRIAYTVTRKQELVLDAEDFRDAKEQWEEIRDKWSTVNYSAKLLSIEDVQSGKSLFY